MIASKIVLQKVGRLEGWAISTSELEPLRQKLRRENYAVKLLFLACTKQKLVLLIQIISCSWNKSFSGNSLVQLTHSRAAAPWNWYDGGLLNCSMYEKSQKKRQTWKLLMQTNSKYILETFLWAEVEFVTPVTHDGSVKFLASGVNFSRNNAIYNINERTKYILSWFHL